MVSRRDVVVGIASVTALGALPSAFRSTFAASGEMVRIRPDATSAAGKQMLKVYADGVRIMKDPKLARDVRSWTFQWYTHFVPSNTTKQKEIDQIFGSGPSPAKTQALLMWSTCQAHMASEQTFNFLPWHRAYVFYFESIVRKLTKHDDFALPYWNYTTNGAIPPEFRMQNDPVFGPLYVENRNLGVNSGRAISSPRNLNLRSMDLPEFVSGPDGVPAGFNDNLDATLHGTVHVSTGDAQNMGQVPFAARDPIFWLHHANIDRIWAGWNAAGRPNPTTADWKGQVHAFVTADGIPTTIENEKLIATKPLGYDYDSLPVPPNKVVVASDMTRSPAAVAASAHSAAAPIARLTEKLTLGAAATPVKLTPNASIAAERAPASGGLGQSYLVIGDLQTNIQPGVIYEIYAVPGETGPAESVGSKKYVGAIQFFDAKAETTQRRFVFDVTSIVAQQEGSVPLSYEIVPEGKPETDARPVIGSMSIVKR